jgi:hypothetical protein
MVERLFFIKKRLICKAYIKYMAYFKFIKFLF